MGTGMYLSRFGGLNCPRCAGFFMKIRGFGCSLVVFMRESGQGVLKRFALGIPDRITSLALCFPVIFRTGLRRWRSVFLFPTTGYLTRVSKSAFCNRRKLFFRTVLSLTRASSRRSSPIRKKHSTSVECFCLLS